MTVFSTPNSARHRLTSRTPFSAHWFWTLDSPKPKRERRVPHQHPKTDPRMRQESLITGPLLDDPHRVGKPLNPPLAPAWTARRGSYRILYNLDDTNGIVEVTAIRHRSDAYRT